MIRFLCSLLVFLLFFGMTLFIYWCSGGNFNRDSWLGSTMFLAFMFGVVAAIITFIAFIQHSEKP